MKIFLTLLFILTISGCSQSNKVNDERRSGSYEWAKMAGVTNKFQCLQYLITTQSPEIDGCLRYLADYNDKRRALSSSDNFEFEAAPSATDDGEETSINDGASDGDCLVSENEVTYVTECGNSFMQN